MNTLQEIWKRNLLKEIKRLIGIYKRRVTAYIEN